MLPSALENVILEFKPHGMDIMNVACLWSDWRQGEESQSDCAPRDSARTKQSLYCYARCQTISSFVDQVRWVRRAAALASIQGYGGSLTEIGGAPVACVTVVISHSNVPQAIVFPHIERHLCLLAVGQHLLAQDVRSPSGFA